MSTLTSKRILSISLIIMIFIAFSTSAFAGKKKYKDWEEVAADMAIAFDEAIEDVKAGESKAAYDHINDAYFGYYEVQGFEKNVMVYISRKRVDHIEGLFGDVKHKILGNKEATKEEIVQLIESLKVKVYKDALVLDGKASKDDPDSVGEKVYGDKVIPEVTTAEEKTTVDNTQAQTEKVVEEAVEPTEDLSKRRSWASFATAFGLLLREGLEAILVIVAIVTYLIKTGNKKMVKSVYMGSLYGIIASVLLAIIIELALGGSGVARELIEGWTMFIAVAVLFYVSNWMISKSDTKAWEKFIEGKVQESIDKKSQMTLVFAAFLAVLREGAELILFYKAAFTAGMSNPLYIAYGIIAGTIVLVVVYVAFRYFSVKLPLKPFFIFTSILLFLMCISFMGKGVIELTEANVILGSTIIPAMNGFKIEILNIYDRAETLIPQIMLVIASAWVMIKGLRGEKKLTQKNG